MDYCYLNADLVIQYYNGKRYISKNGLRDLGCSAKPKRMNAYPIISFQREKILNGH